MKTATKEKVGTIVFVKAETKKDYTRDKVLALSKAIDPFVAKFDGYHGRKMVFSTKNPSLMADIVFYSNMQSFENAMEIEMKSEVCQQYFATLELDDPYYKMVVGFPVLNHQITGAKATIVEVVLFKPKSGYSDLEVKEAAAKLEPILEKFEGYLGRKMAKADDGQWIDILYWRDLESAISASNQIVDNSIAQEVFQLIDEKTMSLEHFEIAIDTEGL